MTTEELITRAEASLEAVGVFLLIPDLIAALKASEEAKERAEAMVAAAYRDAADKVFNPSWKPKCTSDWVLARTAGDVRKSTPADASAALARISQEAADEALERAAVSVFGAVTQDPHATSEDVLLAACETSGAVRQALADQWGGFVETKVKERCE